MRISKEQIRPGLPVPQKMYWQVRQPELAAQPDASADMAGAAPYLRRPLSNKTGSLV